MAQLLQAVIEDSEKEQGYKSEIKTHPSGLPQLTKYWYVHALGVERSRGSATETGLKGGGEISKDGMKAIAGAPEVHIKVENPELALVKEKLKALVSGKKTLDGYSSKMDSMLSLLHAKACKKEANAKKAHEDLMGCKQTLTTFLGNMNDLMGLAEALEPGDKMEGMADRMQAMINSAVIHADGGKQMMKRYDQTWRSRGADDK